jgi:hypothetical protein
LTSIHQRSLPERQRFNSFFRHLSKKLCDHKEWQNK